MRTGKHVHRGWLWALAVLVMAAAPTFVLYVYLPRHLYAGIHYDTLGQRFADPGEENVLGLRVANDLPIPVTVITAFANVVPLTADYLAPGRRIELPLLIDFNPYSNTIYVAGFTESELRAGLPYLKPGNGEPLPPHWRANLYLLFPTMLYDQARFTHITLTLSIAGITYNLPIVAPREYTVCLKSNPCPDYEPLEERLARVSFPARFRPGVVPKRP